MLLTGMILQTSPRAGVRHRLARRLSAAGVALVLALPAGLGAVDFASFDVTRARIESDQFEVEGRFTLGASSDGIDVLNEDVTVSFGTFSETIPAGSFFRDNDNEGFQFDGSSPGLKQVDIRDDGRFRARARGVDLSGIVLPTVAFSLTIGNDTGTKDITFDSRGRYQSGGSGGGRSVRGSGTGSGVDIEVDRARVRIRGAGKDRFEIRGSFVLGAGSDGIDVLGEDVVVTFGPFTETIPAGSFFRDDDDEGFQFKGSRVGIKQVGIRDDGRFRVKARGLDLTGLFGASQTVPFTLQIGNDVWTADIVFEVKQ